jgi:hypothetical protein
MAQPIPVDTDGDGLSDDEELRLGTGRGLEDSDYDGLGDSVEKRLQTDPLNWDTDGDGRGDGSEIATRTDPTVPDRSFRLQFADRQHLPTVDDPDGDGLLDSGEAELGTSVADPDSDDDGLGDWVEMLRGSDPTTPYSGGASDRTTDLADVEAELPALRAAEQAKMVPDSIHTEFGHRIVFPGDAPSAPAPSLDPEPESTFWGGEPEMSPAPDAAADAADALAPFDY